MSKTFRPWTIDQPLLLPASVQDFVGEDHLARFVLALVLEHLDLGEIEAAYASERGQPPFDPAMMTALLLYGYCNGVYSSRRIAKAARERVDFMSIVGLDPPDFRTVSDFRKRHLKALAGLFAQVLKLCEQAGLVKLGHVALDGTKIKANASKHKAMSYERMDKRAAELEAEVERWLSAAEAADAEEDKAFGRDKSGEELPKWVADKKKRAEKIRAAKAELEAEAKAAAAAKAKAQAEAEERRQAEGRKKPGKPAAPPSDEPDPKAQKNFTDPESRIMKTKDGFIQGYNAQAAVDATAQVIVAYGLDAKQSDQHQLTPIADAIEANLGRSRATVGGRRLLLRRQPCGAGGTRDRRLYRAGAGQARRRQEKAAARASPPCAEDQGRRPRQPLSLKEAAARAGVRTDQAGARLPSVSLARRREGRRRVGPRLPRPQYLEARPRADSVPGRPRNRLSFATSETVQRTMAAKLPPLHQTGCANLLHPALRLA